MVQSSSDAAGSGDGSEDVGGSAGGGYADEGVCDGGLRDQGRGIRGRGSFADVGGLAEACGYQVSGALLGGVFGGFC